MKLSRRGNIDPGCIASDDDNNNDNKKKIDRYFMYVELGWTVNANSSVIVWFRVNVTQMALVCHVSFAYSHAFSFYPFLFPMYYADML